MTVMDELRYRWETAPCEDYTLYEVPIKTLEARSSEIQEFLNKFDQPIEEKEMEDYIIVHNFSSGEIIYVKTSKIEVFTDNKILCSYATISTKENAKEIRELIESKDKYSFNLRNFERRLP